MTTSKDTPKVVDLQQRQNAAGGGTSTADHALALPATGLARIGSEPSKTCDAAAIEGAEPFAPEMPGQAKNPDKNYLFDDLIARVRRGPLQWHMVVTVGQPGDPTSDPTIPWPADRERVDVGTLMIDHVETEAPGNCRDINFDPLVLPSGIEPSDDPVLSARSATYSQSFTRREGEKKTPSAVQVLIGKGS